MAQELSQFNFKIPTALLKQLKGLASAKGVTATELVIQGIRHVLGFETDNPQDTGIDSRLYQQLDEIEQKLQDITDYQSAVDIRTEKRIKALEETVGTLKSRLSALNVVEDIFEDIYAEKPSSTKAAESSNTQQDTAINIVDRLDEKQVEDTDKAHIDNNVDSNIDGQVETATPERNLQETDQLPAQLELVDLKITNEAEDSPRILDSIEMLKILKTEDLEGGWDNDRLTTYRRYKKLKDKWHEVGTLRFKYEGESQKSSSSRKSNHLWQVIQSSRT